MQGLQSSNAATQKERSMTLKQLKKRLNPVAKRFGYYTAYEISLKEYVGTISDPWQAKAELEQRGYESPPTVMGIELTAAKIHPQTGNPHDVTLRRIDPDNRRWQWHIHMWLRDGGTVSVDHVIVFSHYEMRPDFKRIDGEDTAEMLGRLQIHYRPEYGTDYYQGKADPVVTDLVND